MTARKIACLVMMSNVLFLPGTARAQTALSGAIAGEVKDTTGALLPGVTVEAASPALIEKVRTVVTDGQGRYQIVDLRPGPYTVTFSLAGFSTVRREGIDLSTGFTANVTVEMKVGSVAETITVSGASPVVDTQNVRSQNVFTRDLLDALPTGKSVVGLGALTLGSTPAGGQVSGHDVGGNKGENTKALQLHGIVIANTRTRWDGTPINTLIGGGGGNIQYFTNTAAVQEEVLDVGGISAESDTGGANLNIVPRDGGNRFSVYFLTDDTNQNFQNGNLSDALRARGVTSLPPVIKIYDIGFGVGGPIKKDKLWFYTAHRWWGFTNGLAGNYFNKTENTLFYTPDLSRPALAQETQRDTSGRLTWQATPKQKVNLTLSMQENCRCFYQNLLSRAPEAAVEYLFHPKLTLGTWSYPVTNRFLVEGSGMFLLYWMNMAHPPGGSTTAYQVTELSTGYTYGSQNMYLNPGYTDYGTSHHSPAIARGSASYVTGSHAFKVGGDVMYGFGSLDVNPNQPVTYTFRNQLPVSLTEVASPFATAYRIKPQLGIYAQDQWVIKNLTLNLGVRYDSLNVYIPAQVRPAGYFLPAIPFAPVDGVPSWKDVNPRVGAAYDLFGNGKTALKVSLGRYVTPEASGLALLTDPAALIVTTTTRTWNNVAGDYVPHCDLLNPLANGECGQITNSAFGKPITNTTYASDVMTGWGVRPYDWQTTAVIQQQLRPGVGLQVGYFRTVLGNFRVTDNTAVTPADYNPFCVTAPVDPRLPGGGGNQVCGLRDLNPVKLGQVQNLVTQASNFGKQTEVYNGVDIAFNARFGRGGLFAGGVNTGRTVADFCDITTKHPEIVATTSIFSSTASPTWSTQFCRQTQGFAAQTQVKFSGSYPLPWDTRVSAVFQNLPGFPTLASRAFTNAEIAPSLGRNLGQCGTAAVCTGTVVLPQLYAPFTTFEDRLTQLDVRLSKRLRVGDVHVQGMLDIYNILNGSTVLLSTTTYGPQYLRPTEVLPGRLFKLGAQIDF